MAQASKGEKTREHILRITRELLISQGYYNTSISSIIQATGVKKGNLYYHFSSKEELGLAVLEDAGRDFLSFLHKSLVGDDPVEQILNSTKAIFAKLQEKNFTGGCLFGNSALEMSDTNLKFASVIKEIFANWTAEYQEKIVEAQKLGLVPKDTAPTVMARSLIALIEGSIMLIRVSKDEDHVRDCMYAMNVLLKT